jgi:hypothetical protein
VAQEFVIRISGQDAGAEALIKKITSALSKVTDPVDKAQKRLGKLGDVGQSGLSKVTKGFDGITRAATGVVDKIVEIVPGLAAIGSAASVAGLTALATKFGTVGFNLNKSSKLLDINAQELAAWHVAAKRAGVSAEEFDSAMSSSQMSIRAAAFGADPHAMVLLQKMGVQIARNRDGTIDYYTTQMRLMKAVAGQKSVEAQRDAAGTFGFGALLPMLQQGTYAADKARALRKGLVPTNEEIARAVAFHQNVNDLEDSVTGLARSIGSGLIPILDPVVKKMAQWLDRNRADIADKITSAVQKFVDWLSRINWDEVSNKSKELFDNMGGLKTVLIAIAALTFAGPISSALGLISTLGTLTGSAIPAALGGLTGLGLLGLGGAALFTIDQLKNSTEPGHFVGRNPGAPNQKPLRDADTNTAWWDRQKRDLANFFVTPNGQFVARNDRGSHGGTAGMGPLGIRSNNPLNMLDHDNEIVYSTPEAGIAAAVRNLRKGYRGLTLAAIADKWTGGARTGNTPQQMANYLGALSNGTGLSSDQVPDLNNQAVVAALIKAQIRAENGMQPYTDTQINAGINAGDVSQPAAAAASPPAGSLAQRFENDRESRATAINITFHDVPQGVRAEAKTPDGSYMPTKVNYRLDGI